MLRLTLRAVMTPNPLTLNKSASLSDAARAMREHNCGGILVTKNDGSMCGIITDRDIVVRGVALGADLDETPLEAICSHDLTQLSPEDTVDDAVRLMANKAIRRIPVVENGRPMGIVSLGDLAQARDERSALGGISAAPPNS